MITTNPRLLAMLAKTPLPAPSKPLPKAYHTYTEGFSQLWEANGLTSSHALRLTWSQIFYSMDEIIEMNKQGMKYHSIVDPCTTGGGKTQGMLYYISQLTNTTDTRVLIVTKQNKDADDLVRQLTDAKTLAAVYNKSKEVDDSIPRAETIEATADYPVLVISHSMYTIAVKSDNQYAELTASRDLICIDEELTMMVDYSIGSMELDKALKVVESISPESTALHILRDFQQYLYKPQPILLEDGESIVKLDIADVTDLEEDANAEDVESTIKRITADVSNLCDTLIGINNVEASEEIRKGVVATLRKIDHLFSNFLYSTGRGAFASIVGGKLYIPMKCQMVFDATAITNKLYTLHKDLMRVNGRVPNARNYSNLTIHTLRGLGTGKYTTVGTNANPKTTHTVNLLINELTDKVTEDDKTLVIVHLKVEPSLVAAIASIPALANVAVSHWGAITGKNDWMDYNKMFIYGFNYKGDEVTTSRMVAIQGTEHTPPFATDPDPEAKDLHEWVETSDISAELIQAMNRVRCRRPIDELGNCDTTDIYIVMPRQPKQEEMMMYFIDEQMPLAVYKDWTPSEANKAHKFEASPLLGKSVIEQLEGFNLSKTGSIKTALVGKLLGYKDDNVAYYLSVLTDSMFLSALKEAGYAIQGKRYKEFRRL